jgi:Fur family ferric uptake transcriptional regulator
VKRNTQQRQAIRGVFDKAERPLAPQEILEQAQAGCPGVGIATVYRAIRDLVDEGRIRQLVVAAGPTLYERTDLTHHHHFRCRNCGEVTPLHGCSLDSDYELPRGFKASSHEVVFSGTCPSCSD